MAFSKNFVGNNVKVEIADAPVDGGLATSFTTLEHVSAFPAAAGIETNMVTVNVFGEQYVQKVPGSRSVPDLTLSVLWRPGAVGQEKLAAAQVSGKLIQVKVTYFENMADTNGAAYYSVVNGYVGSSTPSGDFDAITTRDFVISVLGGPVAVGEVTGE